MTKRASFLASTETEAITAQFNSWDYRLWGCDLFDYPVHTDPIYRPIAMRACQSPPSPTMPNIPMPLAGWLAGWLAYLNRNAMKHRNYMAALKALDISF
jgi:hypothetical protein